MRVRSPKTIFYQGTRWRSERGVVELPDSYDETIKNRKDYDSYVLEGPDPANPHEDLPIFQQVPKQAEVLAPDDKRNASLTAPAPRKESKSK